MNVYNRTGFTFCRKIITEVKNIPQLNSHEDELVNDFYDSVF